jgi:Xaa-Pro aminopeptidase
LRFSPGEMERRRELARGLMASRELGALLVFGTSGVSRHDQANVLWLSGHMDLHHAYLVVPFDGEAALYVGIGNHVPNAREVADVPVVEWGGRDPAATVVERLRSLGLARGRLGLVGVNARFGIGMPWQHHATLRSSLPDVELVDVTAEYTALRLVKSEEEVARLRAAAAVTDAGMRALVEAAQPGVSEGDLVGAVEAGFRGAGGVPHISFLRSMAMDEPNGCLPAQNPSDRRLRAGDVIITELSGSVGGYSGQIHRAVFVESEPTEPWRRMLDAARAAYDGVLGALRPGASEASAIAAAEPIRTAGYGIHDSLLHGFGVDLLPPLIDRGKFAAGGGDERPVFEAGMAVVVQPNPITPDERMGVQLGALTMIGEGGAESLHEIPLEAIVAA